MNKLKGRTGDSERSTFCGEKRKLSGFPAAGLFMNAIALLIQEGTGQYTAVFGFAKEVAQGLALILMGAGLGFIFWNGKG